MRVGYSGPALGSAGTPAQQGDVNNAASIANVQDSAPVGRYNATLPTLTDTRYNELQVGQRGGLLSTLMDSAANVLGSQALSVDGWGSPFSLQVASSQGGFNGSSWDRWRNGVAATLLASAARTATTSSAAQTAYNARGLWAFVNITANPGGVETLTVSIDAQDPVSGSWQPITAFAAEAPATNGLFGYHVYPGSAATIAVPGDRVQAFAVPRTFRVTVTHSAAGSWTYSVGAVTIV